MSPSLPGRYWFGNRWRNWDFGRVAARLGKVPDGDLAKEITAPPREVGHLRRRLGIPRFARVMLCDPYLGKIPDLRLARHFGLAPATVRKRRRALGLPVADRKKAGSDALLRAYHDALTDEETL